MSTYFSIIIPTLNEEQYLPLILSDIAKQPEKNFEVIIVDGKSIDATKRVAEKFSPQFPITFLQVDKRNVSFQRNSGAQKAQGDVLVFLDADNRIEKDFLSILTTAFAKRHEKLFMPYLIPDEKSQKAKLMISIVNSFIKVSQSYGRPLSTGGNFSITKEAFQKIGGFNEKLFISEDHDFINRAYKAKYKAKILKNLKVVCSMRRGKVEGDIALSYKYVVAFLAYTIIPNDKALETKLFEYEMGGQRYLPDEPKKKRETRGVKYLRQLLQISSIMMALRYFQRF